jgi:serine/threonine-protein kinase
MATVFLARDLRHRRQVAIKVLHPELAHALGADRFLREIDTAASLSHPHILPLHDSGDAAGLLYYVMPFIEGESLRDRLDRETQLALDDAVRITREVAEALHHAHERGVIHRGIKPENILISAGHALVADFGIARAVTASDPATKIRLTETGMVIGTPAYMSPEQATGERDVDGRADIYSLGCTLYEMLVGAPPFAGPSPRALLAQHALDAVPRIRTRRPSVTPELEAVVLKALAKTPAQRFATAREFSQALTRGGTVHLSGARRTSRWWMLAGSVVALLLMLVAALTISKRATPKLAIDRNVVAVAPFRVTSADPALSYLREGMVDLLAAKLTGQGGPRAADPRTVLSAWRGRSGGASADLAREDALERAEHLGAGQLLLGNVVGGQRHLVLNAELLSVPRGRVSAQASVEGYADSLPALVDHLTAKLLTLGAGEGEPRLTALTSTSLPALRSYLDGQASYRRGQYQQALANFDQALQLDSTFALAAVGLLAGATRTGDYAPMARGERLAWAGRDRLNSRDRAYLSVLMGMTYADTVPYSQSLSLAERFVAVAPDRVEAYSLLGEVLLYFGAMVGVPAAHERAAAAYRRALELDSTFGPAVDNLLLLSSEAADTTAVQRLRRLRRVIDSAGPPGFVRWRMAVALGDSLLLDSVRAGLPTADVETAFYIGQLSQYDGVDLDDGERAQRELLRRESRDDYRIGILTEMAALALNRGRPAEALRLRKEERAIRGGAGIPPFELLIYQVLDALYWDGDTAAGSAAVRELEAGIKGPKATGLAGRVTACMVEQWRLEHGQLATARQTIAQLRAAKPPVDNVRAVLVSNGCAVFLEALLAAAEKRPDASTQLARLDSLMQTGPPYRHTHQSWNLVIARLKLAQGDTAGALAAVRRRLYWVAEPVLLATYLREEGRLASLTGDRAGAIHAYQHYLAMRSSPEPALQPQVEQVRSDLAQLLAEPRR